MPRKEGGRGLISVEDCVNQAKISLECYVQTSEEELLKAVRRDGDEDIEIAASFKARRRTKNIQERKEKPLLWIVSQKFCSFLFVGKNLFYLDTSIYF